MPSILCLPKLLMFYDTASSARERLLFFFFFLNPVLKSLDTNSLFYSKIVSN